MTPFLSQKCDLHPVFFQTEGCKVGSPFALMLKSHRGLTSFNNASSMVSPHPHGHKKPTDQSSPSYLTSNKSSEGISEGSTSPAAIRTRRTGVHQLSIQCQLFDNHVDRLMPAPPYDFSNELSQVAVQLSPTPTAHSPYTGMPLHR